MLHEILLALSGHRSPLFASDNINKQTTFVLSPPEKELLSSIAHLSDLHCKIAAYTNEIPLSHRSSVCQAVALSIKSAHLAKFQDKVLQVERGILQKDSAVVAAYNIVPLTVIVEEFSEWVRRMEFLYEILHFMHRKGTTGAHIINKLAESTHTGYADISDAALQLIRVAEIAWIKQASSWILYGRLPFQGKHDFFIQEDDQHEFAISSELLPGFVNSTTATSILFIGKSLSHIRIRSTTSSLGSLDLIASHLRLLSSLPSPITTSSLSSAISAIRLSLSQTVLQQLLPMNKIFEILNLLHGFFLLGRGDFAITLISEADAQIRSRWLRADNTIHNQRDRQSMAIKDGEASAVLGRTWSALSSLQTLNDDDVQLDLARDLIYLTPIKAISDSPPQGLAPPADLGSLKAIHLNPFNSLLLSNPSQLLLRILSPIDLFLTGGDIQTYSSINTYLLSIRRAHLRLADLWKVSTLRRHHPSPPSPPYGSTVAGQSLVKKLRARETQRGGKLRSVWATSSAALFLLGEMESYFHGEIVKGTWNEFQTWLAGASSRSTSSASRSAQEDIWISAGKDEPPAVEAGAMPSYDPQTLSEAHRRFLDFLAQDLLLPVSAFTEPLYRLLQQIDHLVALVHRIQAIWQSLDLEADEGVVDAFSNFHKEEADVEDQLRDTAISVKKAIESLIQSLRTIDQERGDIYLGDLQSIFDDTTYRPHRVGRLDRLLMKLDFGGWFDAPDRSNNDVHAGNSSGEED